MKVKLAAGLLVLASTIAGVAQASANVRGAHVTGQGRRQAHAPSADRAGGRSEARSKRRFVKRSGQRAEARHVTLRERERTRHRRAVDAEDRQTGLPARPLTVHNDGDDPGIELVANAPGSRIVAEARRWIGTNPTTRATLWCARFMNFVLERLGLPGTASDVAKSFASYGKRLEGPKVGAIAVMNRGKSGGHVGVVSGFDKDGDPIVISGNYSRRVAEAVYDRSRIIAYVPRRCLETSRNPTVAVARSRGWTSGPPRPVSPGTSRCRNRHSGAARPPAVEPVSHPGGRGAGNHLDSRRSRGDARGLARRRAEGEPGAAILQCRRGAGGQRLSRRRGAWRAVLRLAHRPARPQEALLHHARRSISSRRPRPRSHGISGASRCSGFSPARASAANTRPSTRRSRS